MTPSIHLGAWMMFGHPAIAEVFAGEDLDFVCVDMEHTDTDLPALSNIARALKGTGKELFVRLPACDEVAAKKALDLGAQGIIVPSVSTRALAEKAVSIARFPPAGIRGASLCRASDYGRNFDAYYRAHNHAVKVVVMLEHIDAVAHVDEILSVPGITASFVGPYDLSASMGLAGRLDHPAVAAARRRFFEASVRHGVLPGMHVVPPEPSIVSEAIAEGYRFLALSLDQEFLRVGLRRMLEAAR
jgi:2-dehydro-3-deoxyglucarate aldolase